MVRKHPSHALRLVLLAAFVVVAFAASASSASAALSVQYSFPAALADNLAHGAAPAPGANDFNCKPSAAHPRPVVLVHGTFANQRNFGYTVSPLLKNNGYCVFSFNYGSSTFTLGQFYGLGAVPASAAQLASFVDQVLSATKASKVDIVGHSQGGMMPRYYLKNLGGAAKVNALVGLSPSNHGTSLDGLAALATKFSFLGNLVNGACAACSDQIHGSAFNTALDAGGDTVPGVKYTVITTKYDEVVTPYSNAFLSGPAVTNITVQNGCVLDASEHLAIAYDRRALTYVLNALDPAHPRSVPCVVTLPAVGG
jgi:triacylglycerol esterase/lipase EstA (alpha/beta hydrolase family)